jgi:hypothetical protein
MIKQLAAQRLEWKIFNQSRGDSSDQPRSGAVLD